MKPPNHAARFAERFLHVDMDAFYVEVERLRDPSLRGVPVLVGGVGNRGVLASASYEARRSGAASAMPMFEARRRCPEALVVSPDHERYAEVSGAVFDVLESFSPLVEKLSVDEAFLDIGGLRFHYDAPRDVAVAIRGELRRRVGLPASIGAATTKFLAKLASDEAKPDGLLVIPAGGEIPFLHPLPVTRLWGVGKRTQAALAEAGISTIGQLAMAEPGGVARRLGAAAAAHLLALARGEDPREVETDQSARSITVEETYPADLVDPEAIETSVLELCVRLADRLHRANRAGRTVTLKLRRGDFTTLTRSLTGDEPIWSSTDLWDAARGLFARLMIDHTGVRLLGVGVSQLESGGAPRQMSITNSPRAAVAEAAQEVRARFGGDAVLPARLAQSERKATPDPSDQ